MKTPIQELIDFFEKLSLNELTSLKDSIFLDDVCMTLATRLNKEKEFAHKCFTAGADYGIDLSASIEWGENGTMPTFDEFFKEYEQ